MHEERLEPADPVLSGDASPHGGRLGQNRLIRGEIVRLRAHQVDVHVSVTEVAEEIDVELNRRLKRLEEVFRSVREDFECQLVELNGGANHVQLLVNFPPKVALSRLVNSLKGVSSRRMHQEFPELARRSRRDKRLWSGSYFAGSVGKAPIEVVCQYIEQQERPA